MGLPGIKINFAAGLLGVTPVNEDGLFAIATTIDPQAAFMPNEPYEVRRMSDLTKLEISQSYNKKMYKHVKEFYQEAPEGTPLILIGIPPRIGLDKAFAIDQGPLEGGDDQNGYLRQAVEKTNGRIRGLFVSLDKSIADRGSVDTTSTRPPSYRNIITSVDLEAAQKFAEWAAEALYAPMFVTLECGIDYSSDIGSLLAHGISHYNRVSLIVGDTQKYGNGNILGLMAGRLSKIPVQRNIGRVRDGALSVTPLYIGEQTLDHALGCIEQLNDKGYIVPRTHVGLSGYYFTDDRQACAPTDDYAHLTNRRVVDKAYRVAYNTLLKYLLDEVPISTDGTISPAWCASVAGDVEQAIVAQMTNEGNLGNDPSDPSDKGVECIIDYKQNILSDSKLAITLRIKPNGYVRWIDVDLGFKTT